MTDALMPHGLSYLSKLLNNNLYPSGLPSAASSAIPRRFRHVKSPLDEIMQSIPTGKSNDDEITCKLPHVEIRYFQRPNSENGKEDEDCEEEMVRAYFCVICLFAHMFLGDDELHAHSKCRLFEARSKPTVLL